jgi:hypothetical protein
VKDVRADTDPNGSDIQSWYVDENTNRVTVEVKNTDGKIASLLRARHGDKVSIVEATGQNSTLNGKIAVPEMPELRLIDQSDPRLRAQPPAQPYRLLDVVRYYTGNRIIGVSGGYAYWCTSAVVNYPRTYMYTAGHCFPVGTRILQGYYDAGDNAVYYTGEIGTFNNVEWGNDRTDAASIRTDTYDRRQWYGPLDTTDSRGTSVKKDENYIGKRICTNGSVSGQLCYGAITATRIFVQYPGILACELTAATSTTGSPILAVPGDSGGPVFDSADFGHLNIMGVMSGINNENRRIFYAPMSTVCGAVVPYNCE